MAILLPSCITSLTSHAHLQAFICLSISLALSGCAALLPQSQSGGTSKWETFGAAKSSFNTIVPYTTTKQDLAALGLDPITNANITILNYSDVIRRFIPSSAISADNLDRGIIDCIAVKDACSAYEIDVKSLKKKRAGNFWLDSLNFKRRTEITGWRFSGIVVLKDDLVVYKLSGGQPKIQETEESRNPLGPFQGIAEGAARQAVQ
jgi:hypothetical protein